MYLGIGKHGKPVELFNILMKLRPVCDENGWTMHFGDNSINKEINGTNVYVHAIIGLGRLVIDVGNYAVTPDAVNFSTIYYEGPFYTLKFIENKIKEAIDSYYVSFVDETDKFMNSETENPRKKFVVCSLDHGFNFFIVDLRLHLMIYLDKKEYGFRFRENVPFVSIHSSLEEMKKCVEIMQARYRSTLHRLVETFKLKNVDDTEEYKKELYGMVDISEKSRATYELKISLQNDIFQSTKAILVFEIGNNEVSDCFLISMNEKNGFLKNKSRTYSGEDDYPFRIITAKGNFQIIVTAIEECIAKWQRRYACITKFLNKAKKSGFECEMIHDESLEYILQMKTRKRLNENQKNHQIRVKFEIEPHEHEEPRFVASVTHSDNPLHTYKYTDPSPEKLFRTVLEGCPWRARFGAMLREADAFL